eukprot:5484409-Prymnesium_polylepis.1
MPIAAAATIVRSFDRSGAAIAWLRAFNQPVPQAWELREEQEANAAAGEVDHAALSDHARQRTSARS